MSFSSIFPKKKSINETTPILHKNLTIPRILLCLFGVLTPLLLIAFFLVPNNNTGYRTKLLEHMEDADTFKEFTDALFRYEVTSDSITTAYTLKSLKSRDIPTLQPKLTSFSYTEYLQESSNSSDDRTIHFISECLSHFSKDDLTKEEQLTYSLLKDYMETNSALSQYSFYEELLGSSSGIQANLPVTLGEYPLRNENDIKTYLELLTQIPTYFEDIVSYEKKRKESGYQAPEFVIVASLNSTKAMLEKFENGDNSFVDTFNRRISRINTLSKNQMKDYQEQNQTYVEKYVIPSYKMIVNFLEESLSLSKSTDTDNILSFMDETTSYGICSLPKGKEYYSLLTRSNTGSKRPVEELITMTDQSLKNAIGTVLDIALTDPDTYLYYCEHPFESYYQSPEAILEALSLMIRENYPPLADTPTYEIKMVPDSLAGSLSPAFYMLPAIDDYHQNTIYINPLYTNEKNGNLFPTLAHEGFPGHLYQTVFFNDAHPSDIRHMLDYLGYVEGWATYVELNSFSFLEYEHGGDSLCKLYQSDTIINLALCARIDMGVNYEGWTLQDTRAFFEEQGFNSYYAQDVYAYVVEAPANYLSYFIGYLEIVDIKDAYQRQELENYSEKEFHKKLLEVGPADFDTVRKYLLKN